MRSALVQVVTKLPEAGVSKTRLIPVLGEEGAANLALNMMLRLIEDFIGYFEFEIHYIGSPRLDNTLVEQSGAGFGNRIRVSLLKGFKKPGKFYLSVPTVWLDSGARVQSPSCVARKASIRTCATAGARISW